MKQGKTTIYPEISDILARKAEGRREIAARTFGEKKLPRSKNCVSGSLPSRMPASSDARDVSVRAVTLPDDLLAVLCE
jgi:hypothetical protein